MYNVQCSTCSCSCSLGVLFFSIVFSVVFHLSHRFFSILLLHLIRRPFRLLLFWVLSLRRSLKLLHTELPNWNCCCSNESLLFCCFCKIADGIFYMLNACGTPQDNCFQKKTHLYDFEFNSVFVHRKRSCFGDHVLRIQQQQQNISAPNSKMWAQKKFIWSLPNRESNLKSERTFFYDV